MKGCKKKHPDFNGPQGFFLAVRKLGNGNVLCGPSGAGAPQPEDQLSFRSVAAWDLPQPAGPCPGRAEPADWETRSSIGGDPAPSAHAAPSQEQRVIYCARRVLCGPRPGQETRVPSLSDSAGQEEPWERQKQFSVALRGRLRGYISTPGTGRPWSQESMTLE